MAIEHLVKAVLAVGMVVALLAMSSVAVLAQDDPNKDVRISARSLSPAKR